MRDVAPPYSPSFLFSFCASICLEVKMSLFWHVVASMIIPWPGDGPPFEAVLTPLLARPKAAAPSVAHGLRPLVVALLRKNGTKHWKKVENGPGFSRRRWKPLPDFQKYLGVGIYLCFFCIFTAWSNFKIINQLEDTSATSVFHLIPQTRSQLFCCQGVRNISLVVFPI